MSSIVKITPTWNVLSTFSRNFPPAKNNHVYSTLKSLFAWRSSFAIKDEAYLEQSNYFSLKILALYHSNLLQNFYLKFVKCIGVVAIKNKSTVNVEIFARW